jgi:hypothetical protein
MYYRNNKLLRLESAPGLVSLVLLLTCIFGLSANAADKSLEAVAFSDAQWTGLALSREGRLFVNYPRWPDSFSFGPDGKLSFTTSRIHEGAKPAAPYGIYRISP